MENGVLKTHRELFVVGRNGVCIMRMVHNSRATQHSTPALKMHTTVSVLFSEWQKNAMCIYSKDVFWQKQMTVDQVKMINFLCLL